LLKLAVAAALIYWLVAQGKLDFRQLRIFWTDPYALMFNVAIWFFCYTLAGAFRWYLLLRGQKLDVTYPRAVALGLIGFFFNTAMPGAVGGDIVKAIYVVREQNAESRAPAMVTVLLDRVAGLVGLFVMAGIAVAANLELAMGNRNIAKMSSFIGLGCLAIVVGAVLVFFPHKEGRDPIRALLGKKVPGFSLLAKIYDATRAYRHQPLRLIAVVGITVVLQTISLFYGIYMTRQLTGVTPDLPTYATIYPIGLLATALPLAPGGMGVGHLAFDRLYSLVGWHGGSNVFNVMILGQLALNLLGVIPYVLFKSKRPDVVTYESRLQNT
jgi:uncharacterized protein (TIRG00374 family)